MRFKHPFFALLFGRFRRARADETVRGFPVALAGGARRSAQRPVEVAHPRCDAVSINKNNLRRPLKILGVADVTFTLGMPNVVRTADVR